MGNESHIGGGVCVCVQRCVTDRGKMDWSWEANRKV